MGREVKILGANTCRLGSGATALLCAALCGGVLSAQTPQYRVEGPKSYYRYFIYPGDVLRISVDQHSELSKTVVVMPNGEINLPWLKAASVAGLSSGGN
jgi:protein involved in polysaccharide export with SLBB domain